eukprot:SAG11_NODE_23444_length_388_cov_1.224913_1_plen_55_part_10
MDLRLVAPNAACRREANLLSHLRGCSRTVPSWRVGTDNHWHWQQKRTKSTASLEI